MTVSVGEVSSCVAEDYYDRLHGRGFQLRGRGFYKYTEDFQHRYVDLPRVLYSACVIV